MTKAELGKLTLIQGAIDRVYTVHEIAKRLDLSDRRVKQLKRAGTGTRRGGGDPRKRGETARQLYRSKTDCSDCGNVCRISALIPWQFVPAMLSFRKKWPK